MSDDPEVTRTPGLCGWDHCEMRVGDITFTWMEYSRDRDGRVIYADKWNWGETPTTRIR